MFVSKMRFIGVIMSSVVKEVTEHSDLLWGAAAIGKAIGRSERSAYHLLERGLLPARKVGASWVVSRRKLLRAVVGEEARRGLV
jgi:hypothetical protein